MQGEAKLVEKHSGKRKLSTRDHGLRFHHKDQEQALKKKKDLSQSQVQWLVGKPFNSSQSLGSHECESVSTDPAYQSSAAYSNGTKPRFLWIQSCGKIHILGQFS